MNQKKILILNWRCPLNPNSGGAEKVTFHHAKYWARHGIKVTWLSGNYINGKTKENICGVEFVRFGNQYTIYLLAPFLYWYFFKGNFDLVFDEIHGIPFLTPLWAWKSKKLAYIHEVAQEIWDEMFPFPLNQLGKLYEKIYFQFYKSTRFLTGSNSTKVDLVRYGIADSNISVVPHGLFIKPITKKNIKENIFTVLYVARLVKMKGIEDALKIFAIVRKNIKKAQLWVVGGGEKSYIQKLHKLAVHLNIENSVKFFGYVNENTKIKLYKKAHCLLHTSVREGFGLVVIEANSQGTPVISYNSPGLRDIIIDNKNGFLFQRGEYKMIANKLISLYNNPILLRLSDQSVIEAKKYKWEVITRKVLDLILEKLR